MNPQNKPFSSNREKRSSNNWKFYFRATRKLDMTDKDIHLSLQIVPLDNRSSAYDMIDLAIEVIQKSGLKYLITPMETVIEGPYEEVNRVAKEAQIAVASAGLKEFLVNIKMHIRMDSDVTMDEKRLDR